MIRRSMEENKRKRVEGEKWQGSDKRTPGERDVELILIS